MAWTTPKTFTATSVLTAAEMNTYVSDNTAALAARSYFVPLTTPLTSTSWDGDSFSTTGKTLIDLSDVFGAPAGIKAVLVRLVADETGGSTKVTNYFGVSPNDTAGSLAVVARPRGSAGLEVENSGICPCNVDGDIYYQIDAYGSGTMNCTLEIWGYWL